MPRKICYDLSGIMVRSLSAATDSYLQIQAMKFRADYDYTYPYSAVDFNRRGFLATIKPSVLGLRPLSVGPYRLRTQFRIVGEPYWRLLNAYILNSDPPTQIPTRPNGEWTTPFQTDLPDMSCITQGQNQLVMSSGGGGFHEISSMDQFWIWFDLGPSAAFPQDLPLQVRYGAQQRSLSNDAYA
jgi:hypothetical protein